MARSARIRKARRLLLTRDAAHRVGRRMKMKSRFYHICGICGRSRGYIRMFGICRICFRELAHAGHIPGLKKTSW